MRPTLTRRSDGCQRQISRLPWRISIDPGTFHAARATGMEVMVKRIPALLVATLALALSSSRLSASDPVVTTVMTHLDNPRGLAFGPGGALFVAEAGYGGAPCPPVP